LREAQQLFPFAPQGHQKPWFPKFCEAKPLPNLRETIKRAALAWKEKKETKSRQTT